MSVATLERRLSGICWRYRQLGEPLDTQRPPYRDRARRHPPRPRPPARPKGGDLRRRTARHAGDLDNDLRGLRDRAILAIGFAGGCAAPKSSASIAAPSRPRTEPAGSKSLRAEVRPQRRRGAAARQKTTTLDFEQKRGRPAADHQRQDRLARGRNRPRLAPRHLPGRAARDLDAAWPRRSWAAVPPHRAQKRRRLRRAPDRQARRPARAKKRARSGHSRRSHRRGTQARLRRPFAARRPRLARRRSRKRMCKSTSATPARR